MILIKIIIKQKLKNLFFFFIFFLKFWFGILISNRFKENKIISNNKHSIIGIFKYIIIKNEKLITYFMNEINH